MALAQSEHHRPLRFVLQRVERLKAKTSNGFERIIRDYGLAEHRRYQRQRFGEPTSQYNRAESKVMGMHLTGSLHAHAIKCVAMIAAIQAACSAKDQFTEHRRLTIAVR